MRKRSGSSARGVRVVANASRTARKIDFSDIPDSLPEQLKAMRRVGRSPPGDEPRQLVAIRVDPGVLDEFRKEARRRRVGYQTLINVHRCWCGGRPNGSVRLSWRDSNAKARSTHRRSRRRSTD